MKETTLHGPHCSCKSGKVRHRVGYKPEEVNLHLKFHPTQVDSDDRCVHCGHYAIFNHKICQHDVVRITDSTLKDINYKAARSREMGRAFLGL